MLGNVRIRIGLVHYETYRDFLQIPGNYPDDEDLVEIKAIEEEYAKGNTDLHGNFLLDSIQNQNQKKVSLCNHIGLTAVFVHRKSFSKPVQTHQQQLNQNYKNYNIQIILKLLLYERFEYYDDQSPPKEVQYEPTIGLSVYRKSIYYTGNYRKLARGLSQTPWIVDGERKTEGSVEEYILAGFKKYFNAQVYKFHSAGREDVDVRMLFEGRPFV